MIGSEVYAWSVGRTAVIAVAVIPAAVAVCHLLAAARSTAARRIIWAALFAPLLTPALAIGYVYRPYSIMLVHHALFNDVLYAFVMVARLTPLAVMIMYFCPRPAMSPTALWCARLALRGDAGRRTALGRVKLSLRNRGVLLAFYLRSWGAVFATGAVVACLFAFHEFEIASMMQVRSWAVSLFDFMALAPGVGESMARAWPALAGEVCLLLAVFAIVYRLRGSAAAAHHQPFDLLSRTPQRRFVWRLAGGGFLFAAVTAATLLATVEISRQTATAFIAGHAPIRRSFANHVAASLVIALAAGGIVCLLARQAVAALHGRRSPVAWIALLVVCLPGLLGSLLISLLIHAVFQWPGLAPLRDQPLPLLLALVLLLFPPAVLVTMLLHTLADTTAVHAARQLRPPMRLKLLWPLRYQGGFLLFFAVCLVAYFDLCTGVILKPRQMTLAPDMLYNLIHYGQTPTLAAMLVLYAGGAVLLFIVGSAVWRAGLRWAVHD